MIKAIMYDGLELAKFVKTDNKLELVLNKGIKQTWLPYIFDIGMNSEVDMSVILNAWIKERVFPKNRFGNKKMLKELGLKQYNVNKIAEVTRCSLLTDPYWLLYEDTDTYNKNSIRGQIGMQYYPYNSIGVIDKENEHNYIWHIDNSDEQYIQKQLTGNETVIEWKDKKLVLYDFKKSHANGGRLQKFWVEDLYTGRQFLIKGSSYFSYEPYCEKMAYIIGKALGIDVLEYDIIEAKELKGLNVLSPLCKHVSICEKIDRVGCYITSVAEIKRAQNIVKKPGEKPITNREVMDNLLSTKSIIKDTGEEQVSNRYVEIMLIFDAIIGNVDRHYGNVHLLRTIDGEFIGAPILDNGASLLAQSNIIEEMIFDSNIGEHYDKSSTIARTHAAQISKYPYNELKNINYNIASKTIKILHDIQPVLNLMPRHKRRMIKKYIVYRLHKYLSRLKAETKTEYINFSKTGNNDDNEDSGNGNDTKNKRNKNTKLDKIMANNKCKTTYNDNMIVDNLDKTDDFVEIEHT